jgi:putative chitinase
MNPITVAQLQQLFPDADAGYLAQVAAELNTNLPQYGLDSALRLAHFFAQVMQEAGPELQAQVENLNYSPAALQANFRYYKNHPDEAVQDGYSKDPATGKILRQANQPQIANKAYGNRYGNGDVASGDGWTFRGRGFIQVTFRSNYAALTAQYQNIYGADPADFVTNPDQLANFPYSVRSAVCFWIQHGLPALADAGSSAANVDAITAVVNKSTNSYAQRRDNFRQAYQAFQQAFQASQ